jgi:hypothetical protein
LYITKHNKTNDGKLHFPGVALALEGAVMHLAEEIDQAIGRTMMEVGSFLREAMERKRLTIEEISKKSGICEKSLRRRLKGETFGVFPSLCRTFAAFGVTFEEFFASRGQSCSFPLDCFCKEGFIRANQHARHLLSLSYTALAGKICRERTSFAHICKSGYPHWMQFSQMIMVCTLARIPLSTYFSHVAMESKAYLQNLKKQGQGWEEDDVLFLNRPVYFPLPQDTTMVACDDSLRKDKDIVHY